MYGLAPQVRGHSLGANLGLSYIDQQRKLRSPERANLFLTSIHSAAPSRLRWGGVAPWTESIELDSRLRSAMNRRDAGGVIAGGNATPLNRTERD